MYHSLSEIKKCQKRFPSLPLWIFVSLGIMKNIFGYLGEILKIKNLSQKQTTSFSNLWITTKTVIIFR